MPSSSSCRILASASSLRRTGIEPEIHSFFVRYVDHERRLLSRNEREYQSKIFQDIYSTSLLTTNDNSWFQVLGACLPYLFSTASSFSYFAVLQAAYGFTNGGIALLNVILMRYATSIIYAVFRSSVISVRF